MVTHYSIYYIILLYIFFPPDTLHHIICLPLSLPVSYTSTIENETHQKKWTFKERNNQKQPETIKSNQKQSKATRNNVQF